MQAGNGAWFEPGLLNTLGELTEDLTLSHRGYASSLVKWGEQQYLPQKVVVRIN